MKNTANNNTVRFTIDFINKKIIGTKASFDKASKGFGPAYEELSEKISKHPDFTLEVKEPKKHTTKAKRTYNGMDFDFMEAYIETRENAEQLMTEYKSVRAKAKEWGMSIYPFTKKWFLDKFDPNGEGFDMEKAKEKISNYRMEKAIQSATHTEKQEEDQSAEETEDQFSNLALAG